MSTVTCSRCEQRIKGDYLDEADGPRHINACPIDPRKLTSSDAVAYASGYKAGKADATRRLLVVIKRLRFGLEDYISQIEAYCRDHDTKQPTDLTVDLNKWRKLFFTTDPEDYIQ
ncbi:MAG TPA: hypothetical protein VFH61_07275 [Thermoleophilia bacterium]|nr:hypothetical protein [Thermoleophilia bacterium]